MTEENNQRLISGYAEHKARVQVVALDQVNKIRIACAIGEGKLAEFPKAVKGHARLCVIARALSNGWEATVGNSAIVIEHPNDGTVDRLKVMAALQAQGFGVIVLSPLGADPEDAPIELNIQCTSEMRDLISMFDHSELPALFINPDNPALEGLGTSEQIEFIAEAEEAERLAAVGDKVLEDDVSIQDMIDHDAYVNPFGD